MRPTAPRLIRFTFTAGVVMCCAGVVMAQSPTYPSSGVDLFVPTFPSLVATDFCTGAGCRFGTLAAFELQTIGPGLHTDALGSIYMMGGGAQNQIGLCQVNQSVYSLYETLLYRVSPSGTAETIGVFRGRCDGDHASNAAILGMGIDPVNGVMHLKVEVHHQYAGPIGDLGGQFQVKIAGLPALADVFLSYQPPSTLSFNVPVRPEGLAGADSFSIYTGDSRHAADLSQAVALQCSVPAGRAPVAGEQLTVPDALPDPSPGEARYYLAAVNYQGQRRAGRSEIGGVLQGRNAAALPVCQ